MTEVVCLNFHALWVSVPEGTAAYVVFYVFASVLCDRQSGPVPVSALGYGALKNTKRTQFLTFAKEMLTGLSV